MCGIAGYIGPDNHTEIESMIRVIAHRGPDDFGAYQDADVALGHRRLSILDLSEKGHQPMFSIDKNWVIVFNGEIYNHLEIRQELMAAGYTFSSTSDTETLLYGYIHFKEAVLNKLNGIFTFAIYNIKEKEIFLARDQFGIKPLYYYFDQKVFLFSSEIKSFLQFENLNAEIDAEGLVNYLNFLWSPGETTALKFVKKLLPSHYLRFPINNIKINQVKYYEIPFRGAYLKNEENEIVDTLERKLLLAVKRQLLSDVPVGFFLSGGLDSSLLVAMVRKLFPQKEIMTFSINAPGMDESEGFTDDLKYAKIVADHLKVDLKIIDGEVDIVNDFDKMIWHLDEPQADAAPLNVLNICKAAREMGFKVLISGAAGDDLFSGYRRHQALYYERYFSKIPPAAGKVIKRFLGMLPANVPQFRRLRKVSFDWDKPLVDRMAGYYAWLSLPINKSLFTKEFRQQIADYDPSLYLKELLEKIPDEKNNLNRMLYWEMKTFLPDHNLNYTDKLSMAEGVEVRVPYLDMELVKYAASIPPSLKMRGKETKYILKKVAERYLPNEIIYRPKTGFGAPVRKWITEDLEWKINEYLSPGLLKQRGIFEPETVWKLIRDNNAGRIDASYTVWCLLAIESWYRQFLISNKIAAKII